MKIYHGQKVISCEIKGKVITDAKISVNNSGIVYICQNERDGSWADDKLGYLYAWCIKYNHTIWEQGTDDVTNLLLELNGSAYKVTKINKALGNIIKFDGIEYMYDGERYVRISAKTNKTIMKSIKSTLKTLTRTEPEKTLYKAGLIDENNELTILGVAAVEELMYAEFYEANKDKLKEIAEAIIAERE